MYFQPVHPSCIYEGWFKHHLIVQYFFHLEYRDVFVFYISESLSTCYGHHENVKHIKPLFIIWFDVLMEIYLLVIVTDFIKLSSARSTESRNMKYIHKVNGTNAIVSLDCTIFKYSWENIVINWLMVSVGEKENATRILERNPNGKWPLRTQKSGWENT